MAMFTLMRKNEEIMMLQIGEDGNIVKLNGSDFDAFTSFNSANFL